jgi:hypothetical protein
MSFLDKLERSLGRFAIHGLSLYLVIGQAFVALATIAGLLGPARLVFIPRLALAGQWWRPFTFILEPTGLGTGVMAIVSLVFGWWIFYFMGTALEGAWGAFRFNLFLLTGYLLTVGLSFLVPDWPVSYTFLAGSVFLVFARLNPDVAFLIFFILPVKVRWLGIAAWLLYAFQFVTGSWADRVQIGAAIANVVLFCGREVWLEAGLRTRRAAISRAAPPPRAGTGAQPRHRCRTCGKTDLTHPQLDFRYCSKCADDACYCPEHIFSHEHTLGADEAAQKP